MSARGHILCRPAGRDNAETECSVTCRSAESLYSPARPITVSSPFPYNRYLHLTFASPRTSRRRSRSRGQVRRGVRLARRRRRCRSILNGAGASSILSRSGMRCALEISQIAGGHESSHPPTTVMSAMIGRGEGGGCVHPCGKTVRGLRSAAPFRRFVMPRDLRALPSIRGKFSQRVKLT